VNSESNNSESEQLDELLYQLIEQLTEQSRRGKTPDLEAFVREHPELESELRELWATAMIAEDLACLSREEFSSFTDETVVTPQVSASVDEFKGTLDFPRRIGDFDLLEEIGRGGMGVVFKTKQISLNRIVALKMILRGELASAGDVARFRAEAEAAARLNHPHIVPVYEVGKHNGQPYFSMKYVEGTTLAKRLADGPLPSQEAAEMLIPVCRAIAESHRHGLLHRDLKPANILIDSEGRPYVSDFGLAKRIRTDSSTGKDASLAGLTQSGAILGTPGYMAPEQAAGRHGKVSVATDIYSLGALLYAMLTGRAPFQAASPVDTVLMVLEQDPLLPRLLNRNADPDLEMIALKCLQKPADLRYPNADALADDLQAYLNDEPISARSSQFSQVISRTFRETHHAAVLENWGLLWMWHSLVLLMLCLVTNWFQWEHVTSRWPYMGLWIVGLGVWAAIFWNLRHRAGPVTFVERQIAHVWAGSMIASSLLYGVEWLLGLQVLMLSPVLALISGSVFLVKAGILTGAFYIQAGLLFLTGIAMALLPAVGLPDVGISLFGAVSAGCFFFPGLKYYRQRVRERN
jgi:serine/threonine protein kinase